MRHLRQGLSARKQGEQDLPPYKACLASEPSQSQGGLWRRRRAQNQCLHAMLAKRLCGKKSPRSQRSEELADVSNPRKNAGAMPWCRCAEFSILVSAKFESKIACNFHIHKNQFYSQLKTR